MEMTLSVLLPIHVSQVISSSQYWSAISHIASFPQIVLSHPQPKVGTLYVLYFVVVFSPINTSYLGFESDH